MKDQDKTKQQLIAENEELRRRAEDSIRAGKSKPEEPLPTAETKRLVHELQVHQIELEMQNEELRRRQHELESLRARYFKLYDLAPVGYFALSANGVILEANLTGAGLLNVVKDDLLKEPLTRYILPEDQDIFYRHRRQLFATHSPQVTELRMVRRDSAPFWVRLESTAPQDDETGISVSLVVVSDITERKRTEARNEAEHALLEGVLESTSYPIFSLDRNYCYTSFNRSHAATMKAIYGANIELGKSLLEYTTPQDRSMAKANLDRTLRGQRVVLEEHVGEKALSRPCFEISHNPIKDINGEVVGVAVFAKDITDRKRAEEALQAAHDELEQKVQERTAELAIFHKFAEASTQSFAIADLTGCISYVNPALCRMSGYQPEALIGKRFVGYYPEALRKRLEDEIIPTVLREGQWAGEFLFPKNDGSVNPSFETHFVIRNEAGGPANLAAVITDITERNRTQEALAASEEKYRLLVETTGTGYLILDSQGRVIDANAEYLRISGRHALEDILGRTVVEWTAPYDVERNAKEVEKCYREGFVRQLEIDYVHPDGKIVPVDINATCLDTDDGRRIVCLCRDITERREAQEALRASEERYELAVRGAGVGIWDYDVVAGKVYFTLRWKTLFGYDENEIGDNLEDWAALVHPDDREWVIEYLDESLTGKEPMLSAEYRLRHKDGSYRWIDAHAVVVRDEQGKALRVVGSHGDITDRKQAQEALRQLSDRLSLATKAAHVGIWDLDIPNNKLVWDDSMFRIYGITPNEFGGAYEAWQAGVHPEDQARADAESQMALRGEKEYDTEFRVVWPDKSVHWIKANALV